MGQLIQFIVTTIHNPDIIVFDEPFGGLDPVNTELLKEMIHQLRNEGKALILSTHRMNEVEELCNRVLMINKGQNVLYGGLAEIKDRYRRDSVYVEYAGEADKLEGVTKTERKDGYTEYTLSSGTEPSSILRQLVEQGVAIKRFEVATPSLYEIFLTVMGEMREKNSADHQT
jgi:ABC-2 type transport system ATP-binding protein